MKNLLMIMMIIITGCYGEYEPEPIIYPLTRCSEWYSTEGEDINELIENNRGAIVVWELEEGEFCSTDYSWKGDNSVCAYKHVTCKGHWIEDDPRDYLHGSSSPPEYSY